MAEAPKKKSESNNNKLGVRFGLVTLEKSVMEPMGMVVDVNEAAGEAYGNKRFCSRTVMAATLVFSVALVLLSWRSSRPRSDGEWALTWDLESELLAARSDEVVLGKILDTKTVTDRGVRFDVNLLEKRVWTPSVEDPLALENVPADLVVRKSVFDDFSIILNKFPVFMGHALLVSTKDVAQNAVIEKYELDALHRCACAAKGLAFYNSNREAGSSQHRRHFQVVPFKTMGNRPGIFDALDLVPKEAWRWSSKAPFLPVVRRLPAYDSFVHGVVRLPQRTTFDVDFDDSTFDDALHRAYLALMQSLDFPAAYNLILTKNWLFAVTRSKASSSQGVSINALAFAGPMVLRDPSLFETFSSDNDLTPIAILSDVSLPYYYQSS